MTVLDLGTSAVHDYRLVEPDGDHVSRLEVVEIDG